MTDSRQITWPAYLVAGTLIVMPLADVMTSLYPWRLLEPRWRFGAVGLLSSALLIPSAGLLIAFVTATMRQHRLMERVIGIVGLASAALCLLALGTFVLDAVQTRAGVRAEMRLSFTVASITAVVKTLMAGAALFAIGWSAIRSRPKRVSEADVLPMIATSAAAPPRERSRD